MASIGNGQCLYRKIIVNVMLGLTKAYLMCTVLIHGLVCGYAQWNVLVQKIIAYFTITIKETAA